MKPVSVPAGGAKWLLANILNSQLQGWSPFMSAPYDPK
jgi:hypothetical protein